MWCSETLESHTGAIKKHPLFSGCFLRNVPLWGLERLVRESEELDWEISHVTECVAWPLNMQWVWGPKDQVRGLLALQLCFGCDVGQSEHLTDGMSLHFVHPMLAPGGALRTHTHTRSLTVLSYSSLKGLLYNTAPTLTLIQCLTSGYHGYSDHHSIFWWEVIFFPGSHVIQVFIK